VSVPQVPEESEAVGLVFGLVAILGLLFITLIAITGPAWLGLLIGATLVAVAWRVTPPAGAEALRMVSGLMGGLAVAWSVLRL
jgi:hypothetical protein